MKTNILILQHISVEDPGFIKDLMIKDNFNLKTIKLYKKEKIPKDLKKYNAMLSMGGPMDTWMENKYPWLKDEKKAIHEYVIKLKKPFLGFCLGCQLLSEVLGGRVEKMEKAEIGILDLYMQNGYTEDTLFQNFDPFIKVLQWHSYQVNNLSNVKVLASSKLCKYQAFRYKQHAYGIQFHLETKSNTIKNWASIPEYKKSLENSLGMGSIKKLENNTQTYLNIMNKNITSMYQGFKTLL
jgi:GMP synthase-like glutamine amidotransferase